MIDEDLIRSLPAESQVKIRKAIIDLVSTGVLKAQIQRYFAQTAEGSESEDKEKLAEKILAYRRNTHGLLALQQMGESFLAGD